MAEDPLAEVIEPLCCGSGVVADAVRAHIEANYVSKDEVRRRLDAEDEAWYPNIAWLNGRREVVTSLRAALLGMTEEAQVEVVAEVKDTHTRSHEPACEWVCGGIRCTCQH